MIWEVLARLEAAIQRQRQLELRIRILEERLGQVRQQLALMRPAPYQ